MPDREKTLGLRQVDVHSGLNILILLLSLHRYAQNDNELKYKIDFHPNGKSVDGSRVDPQRLQKVIHYADCLETGNFSVIVGFYLSGADLSGAHLRGAYLIGADLRGADLRGADIGTDLSGADLSGADLSGSYLIDVDFSGANLSGTNLGEAHLSGANLSGADLSGANLSCTDLSGANLIDVDFSGANLSLTDLSGADLSDLRFGDFTDWRNVEGLDTAKNIPDRLKQQLNLP
jgi:hypothetical protein